VVEEEEEVVLFCALVDDEEEEACALGASALGLEEEVEEDSLVLRTSFFSSALLSILSLGTSLESFESFPLSALASSLDLCDFWTLDDIGFPRKPTSHIFRMDKCSKYLCFTTYH
jgi:hypothetical protein